MLSVENLTRRFGGVTAVDGLSLAVERGEIVGVLGPNGAGKTTTLRMIAGYLRPTGGDIRLGGRSIQDDSLDARRRIGYLPERVALYPDMRVAEYLRYRAGLKGVPPRRIRRRVNEAAEMCGIGPALRHIIGGLSKGHRQRVALADALVHEPELLVLDEPMLGLDPHQIRSTRDMIRSLVARHTILMSSHNLSEVQAACGRVAILHRGRLLAAESVADLAARANRNARIVAEIRASAESVRAEFAGLAGAGRVQADPADDGWVAVRFESLSGDPRPIVAAAAAAHDWPLRELRREEPGLEEIFVALTGPGPRAEGGS